MAEGKKGTARRREKRQKLKPLLETVLPFPRPLRQFVIDYAVGQVLANEMVKEIRPENRASRVTLLNDRTLLVFLDKCEKVQGWDIETKKIRFELATPVYRTPFLAVLELLSNRRERQVRDYGPNARPIIPKNEKCEESEEREMVSVMGDGSLILWLGDKPLSEEVRSVPLERTPMAIDWAGESSIELVMFQDSTHAFFHLDRTRPRAAFPSLAQLEIMQGHETTSSPLAPLLGSRPPHMRVRWASPPTTSKAWILVQNERTGTNVAIEVSDSSSSSSSSSSPSSIFSSSSSCRKIKMLPSGEALVHVSPRDHTSLSLTDTSTGHEIFSKCFGPVDAISVVTPFLVLVLTSNHHLALWDVSSSNSIVWQVTEPACKLASKEIGPGLGGSLVYSASAQEIRLYNILDGSLDAVIDRWPNTHFHAAEKDFVIWHGVPGGFIQFWQ